MLMPWLDVLWTDENEAHLLAHGVTREEAEYVIHHPIGDGVSKTSKRPIVFGYTAAGRKIAIVYEAVDRITVYPITAYDVE
jgi:uncharacterized DUF497 family protein